MKPFSSLITTALLSCLVSAPLHADQKSSDKYSGECGPVEVADMNWNSATFIAHVDQFILEHGFGCQADLIPANTLVTGESLLSKGKPDVIPEFWGHSVRTKMDQAVEDKNIRYASEPFSDGAIEAFWVPAYMVEATPELKTIQGLIKNAHLFSSSNSGKPAPFYGCPKGWNCHISTKNLFKALKLDQANFHFVTPPTGADLDASLQEAYDRKAPWFGYYWSPTGMMGRYKMVMVDFETGVDLQEFKTCTTQKDCTVPNITMYPTPFVKTIATEEFAARAPKAYQYLARRGWTDSQMNEILDWMDQNQADGDAAMEHFLKNYQSIWVKWVDSRTVRSIRKALENL